MTTLFVARLSLTTTGQSLGAHFSKFGKVVAAKIITDRETNKSKGFGFVDFETEIDALRAIKETNGKEFEGNILAVTTSTPPEKPVVRAKVTHSGNFKTGFQRY